MADKVNKSLPMREGEQALVDATNTLIDEVAKQRINIINPLVAESASRSVAYSFAAGNAAVCSQGNAVAIGNNAIASHTESAAIGSYANTTRDHQLAIGRVGKLRTISFVDTPIDATDAATKSYVDGHQGTPTDGSVTAAKLADGAVTTGKVADGAITTGKVADKTINEAKLTDALSVKLNERKAIECATVSTGSIAANSSVTVNYTFNQTHSMLPVILPITYGSYNPIHISVLVTEVTNTKCTFKFTNDTTSALSASFFVAIIDRG